MDYKKSLLTIFILTLLLVSSCGLYTPSHPVTPLFTGAKQFEAYTSLNSNGLGFSMAYAFDSHLMVTANSRITTFDKGSYGNYFGGGVGYYHPFFKSTGRRSPTVGECEIGYGRCKDSVFFNSRWLNIHINESGIYDRIYAKLAVGQTSESYKVSFQNTFSFVKAYQLQVNGRKDSLITSYFFDEPSFSFALGGEIVKFRACIGFCFPIMYKYTSLSERLIGFQPFTLGVGWVINIGDHWIRSNRKH